MNKCRKCGTVIPDRFNGGPALRCSECRAEVDKEIFEINQENDDLIAENNFLRSRCFDSESCITKRKREYKDLQKRYEYLRAQCSVHMNDNARLQKENDKLRKGIERLFARIHKLEGGEDEIQKEFNDILFNKK